MIRRVNIQGNGEKRLVKDDKIAKKNAVKL